MVEYTIQEVWYNKLLQLNIRRTVDLIYYHSIWGFHFNYCCKWMVQASCVISKSTHPWWGLITSQLRWKSKLSVTCQCNCSYVIVRNWWIQRISCQVSLPIILENIWFINYFLVNLNLTLTTISDLSMPRTQ